MSNKIKSNNSSYDVISTNFITKQCHHCENDGELLIQERNDKGKVEIIDKYYLCKPCFLKLLTPICTDCETNNKEYILHRDVQRLEITCRTCGSVLTGLTLEEHVEKRDYTINRPNNYNNLDPINCITYK